jgi:hypothetical protein
MFALVFYLQIGDIEDEALASRNWKLELGNEPKEINICFRV